jgi:hypothetical protein
VNVPIAEIPPEVMAALLKARDRNDQAATRAITREWRPLTCH